MSYVLITNEGFGEKKASSEPDGRDYENLLGRHLENASGNETDACRPGPFEHCNVSFLRTLHTNAGEHKMRKHPKGCIYVTNPRHKLYPTNNCFFIHYKTNAGYQVKYCGVWHNVPLCDAYEM